MFSEEDEYLATLKLKILMQMCVIKQSGVDLSPEDSHRGSLLRM